MKNKIVFFISLIVVIVGGVCINRLNQNNHDGFIFEKRKECASLKDDMIKDQGMENSPDFYIDKIIYNQDLDSCLYSSTHFVGGGEKTLVIWSLINFFTKEELCFGSDYTPINGDNIKKQEFINCVFQYE